MMPVGTRRVLVVGAGGHAEVCIEALLDSAFDVVGCVNADGRSSRVLSVPILGRDVELVQIAAAQGADCVFVAIGDNQSRTRVVQRCSAAGLELVNAISGFAMVSPSVVLGRGVAVLPGAVLNASARVADGVIINTRASVDHDCVIESGAHIAVGASLGGGVVVGERALIGIGSCVVPGVHIGADAIVGAGAAVVADVAAGTIVTGVPAK